MADWPPGCGRRSSAPPGEPGEMPPPGPPPNTHRGCQGAWTWETSCGFRSPPCAASVRGSSMRRVWLSGRGRPLPHSPVPSPSSAARSVWRGSGGRPLPRLPRRRAGPPAAAGGPVSHGRGGRGERPSLPRRRARPSARRQCPGSQGAMGGGVARHEVHRDRAQRRVHHRRGAH